MVRGVEQFLQLEQQKFPNLRKTQLPGNLRLGNSLPQSQNKNQRDFQDQRRPSFTLYLTSVQLLSIKHFHLNQRIIIVGASDTGISIFNCFIKKFGVQFKEIMLISQIFPWDKNNFKQKSIYYTKKDLKNMRLDVHGKLIRGKVANFNMKNRMVEVVCNGRAVSLNYEYLVFCFGLVDQTIETLQEQFPKLSQASHNIFNIDDDLEIQFFQKHPGNPRSLITHKRKPENLVVYGRNINALSFIKKLLKSGINPDRIIYVVPPREYQLEEV